MLGFRRKGCLIVSLQGIKFFCQNAWSTWSYSGTQSMLFINRPIHAQIIYNEMHHRICAFIRFRKIKMSDDGTIFAKPKRASSSDPPELCAHVLLLACLCPRKTVRFRFHLSPALVILSSHHPRSQKWDEKSLHFCPGKPKINPSKYPLYCYPGVSLNLSESTQEPRRMQRPKSPSTLCAHLLPLFLGINVHARTRRLFLAEQKSQIVLSQNPQRGAKLGQENNWGKEEEEQRGKKRKQGRPS